MEDKAKKVGGSQDMEDLESQIKGFRCPSGVHWGFGIEHSDRTELFWEDVALVVEWQKEDGRQRETNNGFFLQHFQSMAFS